MPESHTALLVGGPSNGDTAKVQHLGDPIFVPVIRFETAIEDDPYDAPSLGAIDKTIYHMWKINMFGSLFVAWFHQDLTGEKERGEALLKLILNPQGIALLREYN